MTLREFLDLILSFIGTESLTNDEYATVPEGISALYTDETYDALKAVLDTRESVSETHERLKAVYRAKGVVVSSDAIDAQSQIFIGDEL